MEWFKSVFEKFADLRSEIVWVVVGVIIVSIVAIVVISRADKKNWTAQQLAIGALSIAIAFVLSYIRIWHMPQGGSITLASMLPIMLFAYFYGLPKGLLVGIAYGALQLLQDFYAVHWVQVSLDYGIAFMALALAAVFRKSATRGSLIAGMGFAGIVRYIAHVISGYVFFGMYAPEGQHALVYSMAYNSFVFVDLAICIVVAMLPPVFNFIKRQRAQADA